MYKLEKSPICKVQQIGDLCFLKLHLGLDKSPISWGQYQF